VRKRLPARYEEEEEEQVGPEVSPRSRGLALGLAIVGGFLGLHRFYVGKPGTAVLQIVTLGGMGVWWLYDVVMCATGEFQDHNELRLRNWNIDQGTEGGGATVAQVKLLTEQVEQLQRELGELAERMDFTERVLAKQKDRDRLPS
jgi:TM2 domain-containing membrane protein YozV